MGRYPLYIQRYVRIIKYWGKLLNTDNCIMKELYISSVNDANNGKHNWTSRLKSLLYSFGFGNTWENQLTINHQLFVIIFRQRLIDCFVQKWKGDIEVSTVMPFYKFIQPEFIFSNYLSIVRNVYLRKCLTRIRLGTHGLRVETGRYGRNRIERNQRYCPLCETQDIEDSYHFIIVCPALTQIRNKYIARYYRVRPSVFKFTSLLATCNRKTILNLCKYLKDAYEYRKSTIL